MNGETVYPSRDCVIDQDLLNFIQETARNEIEESVQEIVDLELSIMTGGQSFRTRVEAMVDARLQLLVHQVSIQTSGAGPGRGHRGRTHKKISLSLPEPLFRKVRELEGFMSCHVASALELYLGLQKRSEQEPL